MASSPNLKTGNPLDINEQQKNQLNSFGVPIGAESAGAAIGATQALTAPSNKTEGFRDYNKYVELNAPATQRIAGNINAGIQNETEQAQAARSAFETQALGQIASGKNTYDAGESQTQLNKAPTESVSDKYMRLLSGQYTGPTKATDVAGYENVGKEYGDVRSLLGTAQTAEGQKSLIKNQYNDPGHATAGNLSLDQFLLQNTQPAFESLLNKISSTKPLTTGDTEAAQTVADQAAQAQAFNQQQSQLAKQDVRNAQGNVLTDLDRRLAERKQQLADENERAAAAARQLVQSPYSDPMKMGRMSMQAAPNFAEQAAALGITPQQYEELQNLNELNVDLSTYLKPTDTNITQANVATGSDIDRYNWLKALIGEGDWTTKPTGITKGGFDYNTALNRLTGEKAARTAEAARLAAEQAARDAAARAAEQAERDRLAGEEAERQRIYDLNNPPVSGGSSGDGDTGFGQGGNGDIVSNETLNALQGALNGTLPALDPDSWLGKYAAWAGQNPGKNQVVSGLLTGLLGQPIGFALGLIGFGIQVYDYLTGLGWSEEAAASAASNSTAPGTSLTDFDQQNATNLSGLAQAYGTGNSPTGFNNPNANIFDEDNLGQITISGRTQGPTPTSQITGNPWDDTPAGKAAAANGGYGYTPESWTWDNPTQSFVYTDNKGNVMTWDDIVDNGIPGVVEDAWQTNPNNPDTGLGGPTSNTGSDGPSQSNPDSNPTDSVGVAGDGPEGGGPEGGTGTAGPSEGESTTTSTTDGDSDWNRGGYLNQAKGGRIKGDYKYGIDDVPAKTKSGTRLMLDGGEYIIPAGITSMIGADNLDKFIRAMGGNPKVRRDK
jgi:hypothetical protein